ncbi:MAG: hypothetical protein HOE90_25080 [Bacteriovoracaceae bacterium]|jgi:hypothetical protein|nr:hypothetical protein [Bacteriovoracaceae bacterium]
MNKFCFIFLIFSTSAFAQVDIDFRVVGSSYTLEFNNGHVCKVQPSFSEAPALGYGADISVAKENAIQNCISQTGKHRMFCEDTSCERIAFNNGNPIISVSNRGAGIGVYF